MLKKNSTTLQRAPCLLIASVWGKTTENILSQISTANMYCDGVELCSNLSALTTQECLSLRKEIKGRVYLSEECADYHNYSQTPSIEALWQILHLLMQEKKPYCKIACYAQNALDSLRMLLFMKEATNKYPNPIIGLCMGEEGKITRILAPWVGSAATFTYIQAPSAEGQVLWSEMLNKYFWKKISPQTKVFALLGDPVDQSPSDSTHNRLFFEKNIDAVYVKIKIEKKDLSEALKLIDALGFAGCSITIPHKEKILSFIKERQTCVQAIGAANTMCKSPNSNTWCLANTDFLGGVQCLERWLGPLAKKNFLILGAGGSARALAYGILQRGGQIFIWSRRQEQSQALVDVLGGQAIYTPQIDYDVMINTTPVDYPSKEIIFHKQKYVFDLRLKKENYLLHAARENQCYVKNGLDMFLEQAQWQFKLWHLIPS